MLDCRFVKELALQFVKKLLDLQLVKKMLDTQLDVQMTQKLGATDGAEVIVSCVVLLV